MATSQHPAVVIIARHGARLDAADKQWHFTSPTPYDPPLTYGGWHQARALGARIATILQAREEAHEEATRLAGDKVDGTKHRRKKHKVIIHSSPFTRCVQTSIAISAGLAQYSRQPASASITVSKPTKLRSSKLAHDASPSLSAIPEPVEETSGEIIDNSGPPQKLRTTQLRVDAFLGEWLSPDYFEQITPPPGSVMMVAHAKAELLRPGETIEGADLGEKVQGHFPGGWSSGAADSSSIAEESNGIDDLSPLAKALPRSRANTLSHEGRPRPRISTNINSSGQTYVPPTPTYAVSTSDPIPPCYVAHARDACVDVDYRWDSMRQPHDWGNGGEYGEEWSAMHKRFRSGLHKMIGWYKEEPEEVHDEVDVDTVLVLVTHGAGCNALIGAVTNQPVLLDVAMASLTMAVRKETSVQNDSTEPRPVSPRHSRGSSLLDLNIAEDYEVKTMASVEHLRAGSTPGTPAVGPLRSSSTPFRRNFGSVSSADWTLDEHTRPSTSEGLRRSSSNAWRNAAPPTIKKASGLWGSSTPTPTDGLWGSNKSTPTEVVAEPSDADLLPNFANANADPSESFAVAAVTKAEMTNGETRVASPVAIAPPAMAPHVPLRTASQRGLWGGGGGSTQLGTAKRRWTVNEQT